MEVSALDQRARGFGPCRGVGGAVIGETIHAGERDAVVK
jgi:hypothetical protein